MSMTAHDSDRLENDASLKITLGDIVRYIYWFY